MKKIAMTPSMNLVNFETQKMEKITTKTEKMERMPAARLAAEIVEQGNHFGAVVSYKGTNRKPMEQKIVSISRSKINTGHPQFVEMITGTNCCIVRTNP